MYSLFLDCGVTFNDFVGDGVKACNALFSLGDIS